MKKIISTLIMCVLLISSLSLTAFAANNEVSISEIPVTEFESYNEFIAYLENIESSDNSRAMTRGATVISAGVIRSGTTSDCELYIYWTGDEIYNSFRFKSMTVKSTSLLFPTTYGTFGNGSTYTTKNATAGIVGSVKVGDVTIDSDVTKVKVSVTDLQGYNMKSASWLSAVEFTGTVTIN